MILNEEKFLEDFSYEIPEECEKDFTLIVKQSRPIDINSLGIGFNNQRGNIDVCGINASKGDVYSISNYLDSNYLESLDSWEDLYYKLPNNLKYQFKFIIPRADKNVDNSGLILPVNDDSRNYFNTFLKGALTQEDGLVSYNKIYNRINTRIPEKYKCNGNYIIECKFLPFSLMKCKNINHYSDVITIFDISNDIGSNKSARLNHLATSLYDAPSVNDLYFIMFDFNIEGYSEDDGMILSAEEEKEGLRDLLYHRYGNVFPRKPYKIIHKKYFGDDMEILVYKMVPDFDYEEALEDISSSVNINFRIGNGQDKFVMVWEKPKQRELNKSENTISFDGEYNFNVQDLNNFVDELVDTLESVHDYIVDRIDNSTSIRLDAEDDGNIIKIIIEPLKNTISIKDVNDRFSKSFELFEDGEINENLIRRVGDSADDIYVDAY